MSNFKRQSFPMSVNQDSSRVANFYKKSLVKRLCFFIHLSFFLFPAFSFAQTKQIDSLKKILPKLTDTLRVDYLNQLSLQYILSDKKDSGEYYSTLAYNEAKKLNYINGIAVSFSRKAHIAKHFDDDFIQSEKLAKEALQWYERTGNKAGIDTALYYLTYAWFAESKFDSCIRLDQTEYLLAEQNRDTSKMLIGLSYLVSDYRESGNYEQSFLLGQKRYELAVKAKNKIATVQALYRIAQLYESIEDYPNALTYFRKVRQMDDGETRKQRAASDNDIWFKMQFSEVFSHLNQFDSAWYYYHLFKPSKDKAVYMRVYWVSTGECYFLQKDYAYALQNFKLGLEEHKKRNDRNQIMRTLLDIGKTYLALNNNSQALQYGREGLSIALQTKAKQFIRDGYQILSIAYDNLHKTDSAYFYYKKYMNMKDSVLNDQARGRFAAYNYEQKIASLNKEKLIEQQQLQIQHQQLEQKSIVTKMLIAGIAVILLLGMIILRNFILKRKNEANRREIAETELQVERLGNKKTKAELQHHSAELEMQALRAQMNPHFIFNSLNSINMFILENNKLQASEYLSKFSRLIRLILQNSKEAFIPLESELEALQLYLELESLRFENKFEYKILVHEDVDTILLKVPPLIIQPYAENAIWHGLLHKKEKGHLAIELYQEEEILFCKIVDDGLGRNRAAELKSKSSLTYKSMGMRITGDRIAMLQREQENNFISITDLVLADGSAGGTEVLIKIPLHYD